MRADTAAPQILPVPGLSAAATPGAGGLAGPQGQQTLHGSKSPGTPTHWDRRILLKPF